MIPGYLQQCQGRGGCKLFLVILFAALISWGFRGRWASVSLLFQLGFGDFPVVSIPCTD